MTKQHNKHSAVSAAPAVRRRWRQWIGPVTAGGLTFAAVLVFLQQGGSPLSSSNPGQAPGTQQALAGQDTVAPSGGARDGVGTRLAQAFRRWLPHGGSSSAASESTPQSSTNTMHAQWGDSGVPHDLTSSRLAATQDGQPGSGSGPSTPDSAAMRVAVADGGPEGDAAGSPQTPVQREKVSRGLSARSGGGVEVDDVPPGSIAGKLGLQSGDVILSVNGNAVSSPEEFAAIYHRDGLPRQVEIIRDGRVLHRH